MTISIAFVIAALLALAVIFVAVRRYRVAPHSRVSPEMSERPAARPPPPHQPAPSAAARVAATLPLITADKVVQLSIPTPEIKIPAEIDQADESSHPDHSRDCEHRAETAPDAISIERGDHCREFHTITALNKGDVSGAPSLPVQTGHDQSAHEAVSRQQGPVSPADDFPTSATTLAATQGEPEALSAEEIQSAIREIAETALPTSNGSPSSNQVNLSTLAGSDYDQLEETASVSALDLELISQTPSPPQPEISPADQQPPPRRPRPAVHHDRRGARRSPKTAPQPSSKAALIPALRQAETRLRLAVDPVRRSVRLSVVLLRREGFPDRIEVDLTTRQTVYAFDEARYDDIDVPWTEDLLVSELRVADSKLQIEWIRSARPIHLFAPAELDFLSASGARLGIEHMIICRDADIDAVSAAASSAFSPPLKVLRDWPGIPEGWAVLTGYRPYKALPFATAPRLTALDPGSDVKLQFVGGLEIRHDAYAEGRPPQVLVEPVPPECRVFIGGVIAAQLPDGAWIAPGWEIPGEHLVDVVPGPSRTYTVLPDPGGSHESWTLADALAAPTTAAQRPPAALAIIAGARVCAPGAQTILATDSSPTVIALGARANQRPVSPRPGLPAAVALLPFEPAFLVVSSGRRRKEGKVIWLGNAMAGQPARMGKVPDLRWISTVLGAAARRLPVNPDSESAKTAWRSAVAAARRAQRHSS